VCGEIFQHWCIISPGISLYVNWKNKTEKYLVKLFTKYYLCPRPVGAVFKTISLKLKGLFDKDSLGTRNA
jgi:hypothetical protein